MIIASIDLRHWPKGHQGYKLQSAKLQRLPRRVGKERTWNGLVFKWTFNRITETIWLIASTSCTYNLIRGVTVAYREGGVWGSLTLDCLPLSSFVALTQRSSEIIEDWMYDYIWITLDPTVRPQGDCEGKRGAGSRRRPPSGAARWTKNQHRWYRGLRHRRIVYSIIDIWINDGRPRCDCNLWSRRGGGEERRRNSSIRAVTTIGDQRLSLHWHGLLRFDYNSVQRTNKLPNSGGKDGGPTARMATLACN